MTMLQKHAMRKLLIVDDDEILQSFLQKYLDRAQYETESLLDGSHLPGVLSSVRTDLIVLDVELPSKDGFYWLNLLKMRTIKNTDRTTKHRLLKFFNIKQKIN